MSNSYPPAAPKRLVRSTSSRVIGGVCGGVAQYLNMDPTLVRILTVLISLFTGVPVILYIIALFVIPEDTSQPSAPPPVAGPLGQPGPFAATQTTTPPPAYAPYQGPSATEAPRATADDSVWGSEGPPWEQRQSEATPAAQATPPIDMAPTADATPADDGTPAAEAQPIAPSSPEAPVVPPPAEGDQDRPEDQDKPPAM
jgi:phage shock protein PspC (stress-responsive transcriptional regulator)